MYASSWISKQTWMKKMRKTKRMIRICKVQTIREPSLNYFHSEFLLPETFIDDSTEDVSSPQIHDNYGSDSDRTADTEHIGSYYEDLLTRVYSNVHRAGGKFQSSNDTESIIRHRGADDMPMWRVKCRVSSLLNIPRISGRYTEAISSRLGWRKYW